MKIYNLCKVFLICIFIFTCLSFNVKAQIYNTGKVILIDPGHGGMDGGAVSRNNTLEKDLNLEMSIKLKEILENKGYKVFMQPVGTTTYEDDNLICLIKKINASRWLNPTGRSLREAFFLLLLQDDRHRRSSFPTNIIYDSILTGNSTTARGSLSDCRILYSQLRPRVSGDVR